MSHSQFHCTGRAYLDMHGLIFETSICYWQDQPGSRHPRRARARGRPARAGRRALPTLTAPALSPLRPAGAASRTRRRRHGSDGTGGGGGGREPGAPGQGRRRHPQRGGAGPTPAAGPSRVAAGKEPGPLRSFLSPARGTALPSRARRGRARARAPAPRGMGRPGLTRPRGRPGCKSARPSQREGGRGTRSSPPCRGSTGRARGDSDPPRRVRPRDRGPCRGGSLRSGRGCGTESRRSSSASGGGGRPPAARGTRLGAHPGRVRPHARFLAPFSRLSRPTAQALLAASTRGYPDRGQHRRLACFRDT